MTIEINYQIMAVPDSLFRVLSGTPEIGATGFVNIEITASDPTALSTTDRFTIDVGPGLAGAQAAMFEYTAIDGVNGFWLARDQYSQGPAFAVGDLNGDGIGDFLYSKLAIASACTIRVPAGLSERLATRRQRASSDTFAHLSQAPAFAVRARASDEANGNQRQKPTLIIRRRSLSDVRCGSKAEIRL